MSDKVITKKHDVLTRTLSYCVRAAGAPLNLVVAAYLLTRASGLTPLEKDIIFVILALGAAITLLMPLALKHYCDLLRSRAGDVSRDFWPVRASIPQPDASTSEKLKSLEDSIKRLLNTLLGA